MPPQEALSGSSVAIPRDEIEQPVLVSEIIGRDGSRSIHFRVFCPYRAASVPLDTCRACPSLREVGGEAPGNGALVRCGREARPDRCKDGESLEGGPAGATLKTSIAAVRDDLAIEKLRSYFVEHLISSIYVVDESHRLLGVVRDVDLLVSRHTLRPTASHEGETAAQVMSATSSVPENIGVRTALVAMARANQRRAAVVTSEGMLLGVLDDVAGLKWLVGRR